MRYANFALTKSRSAEVNNRAPWRLFGPRPEAGGARFFTKFANYRAPLPEEIRALCAAVGYHGRREGLPAWLIGGLWGDPRPVSGD